MSRSRFQRSAKADDARGVRCQAISPCEGRFQYREGAVKAPLAGLVARVALAVAGVAAGILAGEILARAWYVEPTQARESASPPSGLKELTTLFELAAPNIEGVHKGVYHRTNRHGFRGPEVATEPANDVFRIVAVGDSFVMGEGVAEEEAYAAVLADLLNEDSRKTRYEVLNLGLSGLNIHHVVERLETLGLSLGPDLILYGLTANDLEVVGYRRTIDSETIARQQARFNRFQSSPSHLLRLLWPRWVSFRTALRPPRGTYMFEVLDNYLDNPKAWASFVSAFDRLAAIQKRAQTPVVVFVHPILAYLRAFHPFVEVYDRIEEAASRRGLQVVQGYSSVAGESAETLWIARTNPHPNARAHRRFAEYLHQRLSEPEGALAGLE